MSDNLLRILSALGNAIFSSFWQMGILWFSVIIYSRVNRKLSPGKLSFLSFLALATGFVGFIVTFFTSLYSPQIETGILKWFVSVETVYPFAVCAAISYIVLGMIPVVKLLLGIKEVYFLKRKGLGKVPGAIKIFVSNAVQYLGIKKKVKIFTSTVTRSPLTAGFWKPVILLPVAILNNLNTQQVEAIILHELAHIKRNDYLLNIITQTILTILYFNPFAKFLANLQNLEREKSADNRVLQFEYNSYMYASTLLALAKQGSHQHSLGVEAAGKTSPLFSRIEWMMGPKKRKQPGLRPLLLLGAVVLMAISITVLKTPLQNDPPPQVNEVVPVVAQPQYSFAAMPDVVPVPDFEKAEIAVAKNNAQANSQNNTTAPELKNENRTIQTGARIPVEEQTPVARFASAISITAHQKLSATQEQNVQEALNTAKQIIVEMTWKEIETALAETVTSDNKKLLKDLYLQKMDAGNWQKQADQMRLYYDRIDWEKAGKKLNDIKLSIKLDSIYSVCQAREQELKTSQKLFIQPDSAVKMKNNTVNKTLSSVTRVIQAIDSMRSKKIVDL